MCSVLKRLLVYVFNERRIGTVWRNINNETILPYLLCFYGNKLILINIHRFRQRF